MSDLGYHVFAQSICALHGGRINFIFLKKKTFTELLGDRQAGTVQNWDSQTTPDLPRAPQHPQGAAKMLSFQGNTGTLTGG